MSIRRLRRATRGRARYRACALRRVGGHRVEKRRLTRGGAPLDRRTQTTAARRKPMNADHVEHAPATQPQHPKQHAPVSSCPLPLLLALVRVVSPIGEGPPEGIGSQLE
ncbi:hypothetical protein EVAR_90132_1 [Eumeta japonica]|uniref:Uncharacterized protein n=1 Tax=Eumeta variegata TaxID=151549 RepID=A0A4C1ZYN2_EUMVA|nr:hypothetical protein EVAR_90132_1 [Eumeta japonica]